MGQAPDELTGTHAGPGSPEQIETEIAGTRSALSADLDELTDRLSPSNVAQRQADKVKERATGLKDRVMGSAHDAADSVMGSAHDAADSVRGKAGDVRGKAGDVRHRAGDTGGGLRERAGSVREGAAGSAGDAKGAVTSKTRGNPLAAGVIAFGAGWLLSSLLPSSEKEAQATSKAVDAAKEHSGGVVEAAKGVVSDVRGNLQEQATQAAQHVADTAKEGVEAVRSDAQDAATHVKEHGQSAAGEVKDQGQSAAGEVKDQGQSAAGEVRGTARG
ncbi:DUF3618 domain-containing protein [Kineococcus arenarius]|uniref:DUF3618 domain-containing protein n=1 Tax=unclassified Kineococcus TaxID=2621656 RepID=UPI003D7CA1EF